jgi:hypothetical protein
MFTVTGIDGPDGLHSLIAELEHAAAVAPAEAGKVVTKGAVNIKKDWRKRWSGFPHAPALPYAIGFDLRMHGTESEAEIGPDKDKRQGALGNLFEYGSVKNPPIPGGAPALEAERPKFEQALSELPAYVLGERWR